MKTLATVLAFALIPALARAEDAWKWTDAHGTIHYTNSQKLAPADADAVTTRLTIATTHLPGGEPALAMRDGEVVDAAGHETHAAKRPHRIYPEERLRFGCFAGQTLYAGGWAHPDDISVDGGCLPYLLGPTAWLNAAKAELSLREHGIDWHDLIGMYVTQRKIEAAIDKRLIDE